jgi:hypothetical protein
MPFAQASSLLSLLLGVQVGKETVRRLTEQAGRQVEQAQTQAAKAPWQEETTKIAPPARLVMSADGAYVPLVKGQWAEVRTLAIGKVKMSRSSGKKPGNLASDLSYFSRMTSAETFTDLAEVETRRRKLVQAEEVGAVMDGADWLQGLVDVHRPDALRILDFPHAAEHIALLLQALEQAGMNLPSNLLPRLLHHLKHRGPRALLRLVNRLPAHLTELEGVREHLGYLRKREALMRYPQFRKQGWPIGSGSVESANKLVVQARLKGAGMRLRAQKRQPHARLPRNGVCNERWSEIWQTGQRHLGEQKHQRRTVRAKLRRQAALALSDPLSPPSPPLSPQPAIQPSPPSGDSSPPAPAATLPGSSRPSAHHRLPTRSCLFTYQVCKNLGRTR